MMLPNEWIVLDAISRGDGCFGPGECFWNFRGISNHTGLNREQVRDACRSLVDRRLATFSHTLFNEDGMVAGSGYGVNWQGMALLNIR